MIVWASMSTLVDSYKHCNLVTEAYHSPEQTFLMVSIRHGLKVTYHSLYSINKLVTSKSKLPQDGRQVFPYMG